MICPSCGIDGDDLSKMECEWCTNIGVAHYMPEGPNGDHYLLCSSCATKKVECIKHPGHFGTEMYLDCELCEEDFEESFLDDFEELYDEECEGD